MSRENELIARNLYTDFGNDHHSFHGLDSSPEALSSQEHSSNLMNKHMALMNNLDDNSPMMQADVKPPPKLNYASVFAEITKAVIGEGYEPSESEEEPIREESVYRY